MGLKKCKECGQQVSTKAKSCPNCGVKNPTKKAMNKFLIGIINLSILFFIISLIFGGDGDDYDINDDADKFSTMSLNMRMGPSTEYDVVSALSPGEQVKVLKDSLGWNLIETIERDDIKTGWASGNYLSSISKFEEWQESIQQEQREQEQRERERIANKPPTREEIISEGFSAWDGSHRELVKEVKERMHNPDSFDHVETRYSDQDDYLYVVMEFRGTNAFGAVVTQTAAANCDLDGNVIELLSIN